MAIDGSNGGPIRISMLAPDRERCGISDYSRNLISALGELDSVEIVRCVQPPPSEPRRSLLHEIARRNARAASFREIGALLSSPPTQLIHIQHEFSLLGGVAPHRNHAAALYSSSSAPLVITVHEIAQEAGGTARTAAIREVNLVNFLNPVIKAWIVHTKADGKRLAAMGVRIKAIHVVPVGVPTMNIAVERGKARERLGLSNKRVLTIFGFLSAKKGHADAIEAISKMPEDVILILAGDIHPNDHTDYVAGIRSLIEQKKLSQRVRITGYLSACELQQVMAATDVALAPYRQSSGSASVAQLLAAGLPIIATSIPAFIELNEHMPGTLILIGSAPTAEKFGCEVLRVLSSPDTLQEMRSAAARYAVAHSYRKMAEATVEVYRAALEMSS